MNNKSGGKQVSNPSRVDKNPCELYDRIRDGVVCKDSFRCFKRDGCPYENYEDEIEENLQTLKLDAHKMIVMRIGVNEAQIREMEKCICKTQQLLSDIVAMNAFLESLIARPIAVE